MIRAQFATILAGFVLVGCTFSTQDKQIDGSTDVEVGKRVIASYLEGNWSQFRAQFTADAKIWRNKDWNTAESLTIDDYLAELQAALENYSAYAMESKNWSNMVDKEGNHWVLYWGVWEGDSKITGKVYQIPVHIAMLIENNKVSAQIDYFNNTQVTLDVQAAREAAENGNQ